MELLIINNSGIPGIQNRAGKKIIIVLLTLPTNNLNIISLDTNTNESPLHSQRTENILRMPLWKNSLLNPVTIRIHTLPYILFTKYWASNSVGMACLVCKSNTDLIPECIVSYAGTLRELYGRKIYANSQIPKQKQMSSSPLGDRANVPREPNRGFHSTI